jgi:hypothetical protein
MQRKGKICVPNYFNGEQGVKEPAETPYLWVYMAVRRHHPTQEEHMSFSLSYLVIKAWVACLSKSISFPAMAKSLPAERLQFVGVWRGRAVVGGG